jgi:hypothetical protein
VVRSRAYGILAGFADQNDHDTLRHDPVFKLVADRPPEDDDLASQPTLSRFENAISIKSLKRLRDDLAYLVARLRRAWPDAALMQSCGINPTTVWWPLLTPRAGDIPDTSQL